MKKNSIAKYSIVQLHKSRGDNQWHGRCRQNGRDLWKTALGITIKREAEQWLKNKIAESFLPESQKPVEPRDLKLMIKKHMNHLESVISVPNTLVKYLCYLEKFKAWNGLPQNLNEVKLSDAQSYIDYLCKDLKPKTVSEHYKVVRAFFTQCMAYKWIRENPFKRSLVRLPKILKSEREFWTETQLETVLNLVDRNTYPFWFTLVKTGLRLEEARFLTFEKVSLSDREIRVIGKGNKFRKIPICNSLLIVLEELKAKYHKGLCFPFLPSTQSGCLKMLKRFLKDSEFAEGQVTIHKFRHSFASNLIRVGYPIAKVSRLMGHASVQETIKSYLHLLPTDLEDMVDFMDKKTPKILPFKKAS